MAFVEKRGPWYRVVFRHAGQRYTHTLKTRKQDVAEGILGGVQKTLMLLKQRVLHIPDGADVLTFVLTGGEAQQPPSPPEPQTVDEPPKEAPVTLGQLKERYLDTLKVGAVEANSLDTIGMHLRHFVRTFGADFPLQTLTLARLQEHVGQRAKEKGIRERPLSATTIKKEIASLRAAWNWAAQSGLVVGPFPNRGLKYPKTSEKPPFQTWAEIERQIQQGGLTAADQKGLWDCLFLQLPEIDELLRFVKDRPLQPWVYPMLAFAAHTGARRSEMLRARLADLDLEAGTVRIHEKKRAHGVRTSRRVPLSPFLARVLREWLAAHPGGPYLFAQSAHVFRSKKRSRTTGHLDQATRPTTERGRRARVKERSSPGAGALTKDEANDHFKRALAGSRWEVIRGWHCLRHSFISNCAAQGIDQRMLDQWVGHTTEEMRRRYLHLVPSNERQAIARVFAPA